MTLVSLNVDRIFLITEVLKLFKDKVTFMLKTFRSFEKNRFQNVKDKSGG